MCGTLIALQDIAFQKTFEDFNKSTLSAEWYSAIERQINIADMPQVKKDEILMPYQALKNHSQINKSNKKSINGFDDAITSSIDTGLLCFYVDKAIAQNLSGIYNIGTQKPYSKYELISAIINTLGLKDIVLNKRSVKTLAVVRANNCGLDSRKYAQKTGLILPTMNQVVSNLKVREFYNEI